MFELAKRGINSFKLTNFVNYDLLLNNGLRIEVKTSNIRIELSKVNNIPRQYFNFKRKENQSECDFYCFVCLDKKKNVDKIFIVPEKIISKRKIISIPKDFKQKSYNGFCLKEYENKWKLLV